MVYALGPGREPEGYIAEVGSVIGPLMFLVFINELIEILDSYGIKVKFFADDAKLYVKIVNSVDTAVLQAALNALC